MYVIQRSGQSECFRICVLYSTKIRIIYPIFVTSSHKNQEKVQKRERKGLSVIQREQETVRRMIEIYCRHQEGNPTLCPDCQELLRYALARLARCPFGERKTTCRRCSIHCYKPEMKRRIQAVMRYAGPRMLFFHPIAALRHLFHS